MSREFSDESRKGGFIVCVVHVHRGFIFFDGIKWCLSTTLGGTCDFYGANPVNPLNVNCPDIDETIMYEGVCVPTPTPYDPCSVLDFDVFLVIVMA